MRNDIYNENFYKRHGILYHMKQAFKAGISLFFVKSDNLETDQKAYNKILRRQNQDVSVSKDRDRGQLIFRKRNNGK